MKITEFLTAITDAIEQSGEKTDDIQLDWIYMEHLTGEEVDGLKVDRIEIKDKMMKIYILFES